MSTFRQQQSFRLAARQKPAREHACSILTPRRSWSTYGVKKPRRPARQANQWTVDVFGFGRKPGDPMSKWKQPPQRQDAAYKFYPQPSPKKTTTLKHAFAVYNPQPRSKLGLAPKNPMPTLAQREMNRFDPDGVRQQLFRRYGRDAVKAGDVLRVSPTKGEPFAGVLLNLRRRGADTSILLRGRMAGVGVEMWYKVFSTKISRIDVIWRRPKRARRARLYYMRQPKHDMGSVEHLVDAWFRSRIRVGSAKTKDAKKGSKAIVVKRKVLRAREAARVEKQRAKAARDAERAKSQGKDNKGKGNKGKGTKAKE